jgi:hypothetical protein
MRARLLIRPSELRRLNPHTKVYEMPIGNGLFCKERIRSGQQIVHFTGEPLRNRSEVQHARAVSQHGGYVILRPMAWIVFRLLLGISASLLWPIVHISARTYFVAPFPKLTRRRHAKP